MPVKTYLRTFWRPDRDYVDGFAIERELGLMPHSIVVSNLVGATQHQETAYGCISVRAKIREDRFRCIDFALLNRGSQNEQVLVTPPLLCVEVLQHETIADAAEKVADYRQLGVKNIWVLDPYRQEAWAMHNGFLRQVDEDEKLEIAEVGLSIPFADVFEDLPGREITLQWLLEPYETFTEAD